VARIAAQRQPQLELTRQAQAIAQGLAQATPEAKQAGAERNLVATVSAP
jgi:hypothetical protein